MNRIISIATLFLFGFVTVPVVQAQDTDLKTGSEKSPTVALQEDGKLAGKVFKTIDGEKQAVIAKLTLSADGIVIDTVESDEEGNFSFANVAPGAYQMYGYSDGMVGGGLVSVVPFATQDTVDYNVGLSPYDGYDAYAGAPVQSFGDYSCGAGYGSGSCGGGCGGVGRRRLLLAAGLGLGIVAIAGGFDGEDDASPTN